jgi:hypothetical protein
MNELTIEDVAARIAARYPQLRFRVEHRVNGTEIYVALWRKDRVLVSLVVPRDRPQCR